MDEIKYLALLIGKNEAKVLLYLNKNETGCSLDVEQATQLRQPEVSVATNNLLKHQLIGKKEEKVEGKGRPRLYFMLGESVKEILLKMLNEKSDEIEKIRKVIAEVF